MSGNTTGRALVTGAARRIGLVIATRLAEAGYDIALHASHRSQDEARRQADLLAAHGVRTCVVVADLADADACGRIVREATMALGPLSLLVNSAAVFEADGPDVFDALRWDRHFAVNLRAPVILSQHLVAQAERGRDTAIVNVIDQRVLRPTPLFFSYTLAKSALWTATRTMAQAFAGNGIRVNAVGPGPVMPNAVDGEEGFSREIEGVPMHRAVAPEEIAEAVLYLAAAAGVTGQLIAVDAGQHLAWRTPDVV